MNANTIRINDKDMPILPNSISIIQNNASPLLKNPFDSRYVEVHVTETHYPRITFNLEDTKINNNLIEGWKKLEGNITLTMPGEDTIFKKGSITDIEQDIKNERFTIRMTGESTHTYSKWVLA